MPSKRSRPAAIAAYTERADHSDRVPTPPASPSPPPLKRTAYVSGLCATSDSEAARAVSDIADRLEVIVTYLRMYNDHERSADLVLNATTDHMSELKQLISPLIKKKGGQEP